MHNSREVLATASLTVLLVLLSYLGLLSLLRAGMQTMLGPFVRGGSLVVQTAEYPFWVVQEAFQAKSKIQELEKKYTQSLAEIARLEGVEKENETLRGLIENTDRGIEPVIIARTLFSQAHLAVDAGSYDQVKPGQAVVINDVIVGRVTDVAEKFSLVSLLSEPVSEPLLVETESGVQGLIQGDGKSVLLTEVNSSQEVQPGEKVVTVGQPGIARGGFIGVIVQDVSRPEAPVKTYVVDQQVSIAEARLVEVRL